MRPDCAHRKIMAGRIRALPARRYRVSFMAPYSFRVVPQTAIKQVHGKKGDVIPDEYEEQVHAHEEPKHPGYKQKVEGKVLFHPRLQFPHREHAGKKDNAREQQIGQAESVNCIEIVNAKRRNPLNVFRELETAKALVIGKKKVHGQKERNPGEKDAHLLQQELSLLRDNHDCQHAGDAAKENG